MNLFSELKLSSKIFQIIMMCSEGVALVDLGKVLQEIQHIFIIRAMET